MSDQTRVASSRWLRTLTVLAGALAAYVASALVIAIITGDAILGAAASNVVAAVLAMIYRWRTSGTLRAVSPAPRARTAELWWAAGAGLVSCWLFGQTAAVWVYATWGSDGFDAATAAKLDGPVALVLVTGILLAPLGEESLMRGIVFPALRRHWSVLIAAVVSSAVFALLHGNLVQIVLTLPLGILLAFVYEGTQRLWPVVLMHVVFNAAASFTPPAFVGAIAHPIMIAGFAAMLVLCVIVLAPRGSRRA